MTMKQLATLLPSTQTGAKAVPLPNTRYVSTAGNDSNPGTFDAPWQTLNHSVPFLRPGDTLVCRGGTYAETLNDVIPGGESWAKPVVVMNYPGETVILQPPGGSARCITFSNTNHCFIEVNGLTLDAANVTTDCVKVTFTNAGGTSHHIRLKNCVIKNAAQQGVLITGQTGGVLCDYCEILNCTIFNHGRGVTSNLFHGIYNECNFLLVDGCEIYGNSSHGIQIFKSAGVNGVDCGNNLVTNNYIHNNGFGTNGYGIGFYVGDNNIAYNNVCVNNNRSGCYTDIGATNSQFYNNTVYGSQLDNGIDVAANSSNCLVRNCIAFGNVGSSTQIFISPSSVGSSKDHCLETNPLFNNPFAGDFHLILGSAAIGAGTNVPFITTDKDGNKRTNPFTIGAYQGGVTHTPINWFADYVNGTDALTSGTIGAPFKTINYGAKALAAGDTLNLRGVTFSENVLNVIPSGTSSALITIQNYNGEAAVVQPPAGATSAFGFSNLSQFIKFSGLVIDGSLMTSNSAVGINITFGSLGATSHLTIDGCEIKGCKATGITNTQDAPGGHLTGNHTITNNNIHNNGTVSGHGISLESSGNLVKGNTIQNNGFNGIQIFKTSGVAGTDASNNTIDSNRISSNGAVSSGVGITCLTGSGNVIKNNLVYANQTIGINVDSHADTIHIYYNSIYGNLATNGLLVAGGAGGATNVTVRGNAIHGNTGTDMFVSASSAGTTEDYDCVGTRSGLAAGAHTLVATDPKWTSPGTGDFTLQGTSPCINAGVTLTDVPVDFAGVVRPHGVSYCIGAYEF